MLSKRTRQARIVHVLLLSPIHETVMRLVHSARVKFRTLNRIVHRHLASFHRGMSTIRILYVTEVRRWPVCAWARRFESWPNFGPLFFISTERSRQN